LTVVDVVTLESDRIGVEARASLRALWQRAFGDRFTEDDANHAFGGVHVLVRHEDRLVAHASAVPRRIRFGDGPWCTVGYVEAVATDPARQRAGVGRLVMGELHREIAARWPAALLSTGRARGFYEKLGWERWGGTSYTRTADGEVPDHEHGGIMVLRLDRSVVPDLSVSVTCEDRPGDAW
jgi:aminoglycoside 2'-N-acetyltransferase I